jgi:hypothetical protein
MNSAGRRQPLTAVLYSVPLLCEAITSALEGVADVWTFPARRGDTVGLLRSVHPDAIVVDDLIEAGGVQAWAESHDIPLVEICVQRRKIRVLRGGEWKESAGASAESIRNAVAGSLYARDGIAS